MEVRAFPIDGPLLFTPPRFRDVRGFVSETFSVRAFREVVADVAFVQDNHAYSVATGTIRGLHFQAPPCAQGKLVRVVRGSAFDVAVDIRAGSATYGKHVAVELSADNWAQLWIPAGFAHGFCTLEPDTEVVYKMTDLYSPAHERGLAWDDPALAIQWPVPIADCIVSEKDRKQPRLSELPAEFGGA